MIDEQTIEKLLVVYARLIRINNHVTMNDQLKKLMEPALNEMSDILDAAVRQNDAAVRQNDAVAAAKGGGS